MHCLETMERLNREAEVREIEKFQERAKALGYEPVKK